MWYRTKIGTYHYTLDDCHGIFRIIEWHRDRHHFIEPYPELYLMRDQQMGIKQVDRDTNLDLLCIPDFDTRHYFCDTVLNVSGYILFELHKITTMKDKDTICYTDKNTIAKSEKKDYTFMSPRVRMHIVVDMDPTKYLSQISTERNKQRHTWKISEYHVKAFPDPDDFNDTLQPCVTTLPNVDDYTYSGDRSKHFQAIELPKREQSEIATFFHPLRDQIWNTIKLATFKPEELQKDGHNTQFLACLYGPPGTGKSSFAVRVAKATGRHLITVDKSLFRSKKLLRNLFSGELSTPRLSQSIIVFDEFDHVIEMITNKEERTKRNEQRREGLVNTIIKKIEKEAEEDKDDDGDSRKKKRSALTPFILNSLQRVAEYDTYDSDEVTIDDLLDIIQGPAFDKGYVIFATTNNYKKMRDQCPRLFRDGRFKPIYFGYPDLSMLNQISQHYYGKDVTADLVDVPLKPKIPTCRILNHIKSLAYLEDKEEQYVQFRAKLQHDMEHYALSECFKQYEECIDTESLGSTEEQN